MLIEAGIFASHCEEYLASILQNIKYWVTIQNTANLNFVLIKDSSKWYQVGKKFKWWNYPAQGRNIDWK